jgi:serine/threonine-protein kinase
MAALGVVVAAGVAAGTIALTTSGGGAATGALERAEVLQAVDGFARAYSRESVSGLRDVLAPDVKRIVPGARQLGRSAVLAEYRRQFAGGDIVSYRLSGLQVTPGDVGRASGTYRVVRRGAPPIAGRTVFGVVRRDGAPRIALIAAEPAS